MPPPATPGLLSPGLDAGIREKEPGEGGVRLKKDESRGREKTRGTAVLLREKAEFFFGLQSLTVRAP
jgi:hypothetical protein